MAINSNPVYIRAYLCRAQAYRHIHDVKISKFMFKSLTYVNVVL
jgi:hypothetical protein